MASNNSQFQRQQSTGFAALSGRRKIALLLVLLLGGYAFVESGSPSAQMGGVAQSSGDGSDINAILNQFDEPEPVIASPTAAASDDSASSGLVIPGPSEGSSLRNASFHAESSQTDYTSDPVIALKAPNPPQESSSAPQPQIRLTGTITPLN